MASSHPRFAAMLHQGVPLVEALARFGQVLFGETKIPDATNAFRLATGLAPRNATLWTNYGTALDLDGKFGEAAACLEHSLEISYRQPETWLLLGLVKKKLGDLEGCEEAYVVASAQNPGSSTVWQCLGMLHADMKEYSKASECFAEAQKLDNTNAATAANLGKMYYQLGKIPEASEAYARAVALDGGNPHYRQMARKARFIGSVMQGDNVECALAAYEADAEPAEEVGAAHESPANENGKRQLLETAFGILSGFGHREAARRVGQKYLELWPQSAVMDYLMKAIVGDTAIERSPTKYIVEYFDSFAPGFDAKLSGVLGYDVPKKLCWMVAEATEPEHKYRALDAGCGTGLCGPLLRPLSWELTGVDLSPKMLEEAAKRGVYDRLVCEELTAFLNRCAGSFDLVVAADVMVYIGNLEPIFFAAAMAIRPGGLFAFSTESCEGANYKLQASGRFAHSSEYVRDVAAAAFPEHACEETTIRLEAGVRLPGNLFLFRRGGK